MVLTKDFSLIDIWRNLNKNKLQYTRKRKNGLEKSRIDFWLIEDSLRPIVISSDIRPAQIKSTDHMAISLKIQLHSIQGAGYWKMNNSFLSDKNYINLIQKVIKGCTSQYENKGLSYKLFGRYVNLKLKKNQYSTQKIKQHSERMN